MGRITHIQSTNLLKEAAFYPQQSAWTLRLAVCRIATNLFHWERVCGGAWLCLCACVCVIVLPFSFGAYLIEPRRQGSLRFIRTSIILYLKHNSPGNDFRPSVYLHRSSVSGCVWMAFICEKASFFFKTILFMITHSRK